MDFVSLSPSRELIIDEMSLGLSPVLTYQLFFTLKKLRQAGLTILLVAERPPRFGRQ